MKQFSIELASENIVDTRSKEYFTEVLSSFSNNNFRSATVMLWTVVVSDLVYKLQQLKDLYQDPVATSILKEVETKQNKNPNSAEWESYLVEEVNSRTHLLESSDYEHLQALKKLRHLSAHPTLSSANLLFSPNKETVRALIRNSLEGVLLKPPIFSRKIVSEFIKDLASKAELLPDAESLKKYLEAKYFKNLHSSVEIELVRSLWKLSFRLNNDDTNEHRNINLRALLLLYSKNPTYIREHIQKNAVEFSEISSEKAPIEALIEFLVIAPELSNVLTDGAKVLVKNYIQKNANLFAKASFLSTDFSQHLMQLSQFTYDQLMLVQGKTWDDLMKVAIELGATEGALNVGLGIYVGSKNFDQADMNFSKYLKKHIGQLTTENLKLLLDGIENNSQTYGRGRAIIDHGLVLEALKKYPSFNLKNYPNFYRSCKSNDE